MEKLMDCVQFLAYAYCLVSFVYSPAWLAEQIAKNPYRVVFFASIGALLWALGMAIFVSAWYLLFVPLAVAGLFSVFMAGAKY